MENEPTEVQKYIVAYKSTIQSLGVKKANTRIPISSDWSGLSKAQKNPSQTGFFWTGSIMLSSGRYYPLYVDETGNSNWSQFYARSGNGYGVRPILELDMSDTEYIINEDEINKFEPENKEQKLTELICKEDYGKSINYSVTVGGRTFNNWQVFLNDDTNVYIIYGDYLEANLMPAGTNVAKDSSLYKYNVWSGIDSALPLYNWIRNTTTWSGFAGGLSGATAYGGPTMQQLNQSIDRALNSSKDVSGSLYVPRNETYEGCSGYWLNEYFTQSNSNYCYYVNYLGKIFSAESATTKTNSVRPVICLPSDATGKCEGNTIYLSNN